MARDRTIAKLVDLYGRRCASNGWANERADRLMSAIARARSEDKRELKDALAVLLRDAEDLMTRGEHEPAGFRLARRALARARGEAAVNLQRETEV